MPADSDLVRGIIADLARELFDQPVMSNLARPAYVERLVARALHPAWRYVGSNWTSWDLESDVGARLEVKPSAVRQTWTDGPSRPGKPTPGILDIAPRTGYWVDDGRRWVPGICRPADVYVFAHHAVFDVHEVDQRDPAQWTFYVVPEYKLPAARRTLGLAWLQQLSPPIAFEALLPTVDGTISSLSSLKRDLAGALT